MKKKISAVLAVSMIATNISPAINVYANEIVKEKARIIEENAVSQAKITSFNLSNYSNFEDYNAKFRVPKEGIKKISNNGGIYDSSSIEKAIDGDLSTHWETGTPNSTDFKNEVVIEFNDVESINRIAYTTRQDSAKGKGYPTQFEIYSSITGNNEDFKLVSTGEHSQTGNMMEFKFDTITTKKVKFVFKEAHDEWASASEFWFYKEDKIIDKLNTLFKDENKNAVSDEFNTLAKLTELENECKTHPFYNDFKEDLNDAKYILENDKPQYVDAKVSKFKAMGTPELAEYDKTYKIDNKHITNITTNGRHWSTNTIDKAIDGDPDTYWHSDATNNETHTNEVIMTLDELQTLDKVVYTSQRDRGFAKEFEIYTSKTLSGDTFTKVTSGSSSITKDSIAIKFNTTQARRVKFVFKNGHEGWALASEFGLYKEDATMNKMDRLFTDSTMSKVSDEFNTSAKLKELEDECKKHPFYNDFKEDLNDAKYILEDNKPQYVDAKVSKFKAMGTKELEEYDKTYKIDNKHITNITTNGRHWSTNTIDKAIDGDPDTYWHSDATNNETHTNEVIMTLDELQTLDKVVYTSQRDRGFAKEFEIYTSKTLSGDTFTKVTSGSSSITKDSIAIKFNTTQARRVKFVFKNGHEGWALASEFGLYKEDATMNKMDRLFTDSTMSKVSDEFNTSAKLKELEDECKKHPFYNDFKEDLDNAKAIIESVDVDSSVASTKKFNHLQNTKYIEQFRMPYDNIKRISNNGGQYLSQNINNAIDDNVDTYWETNTGNSKDWKNEVTVEFVDAVTIDKIVYGARQSDRKGFLEEFEIYGSNTTKGDTFKLVATAKADFTTGLVEVKFKPTKFKRLKIKVTKSNQNWATLNELMFFKEDVVADKVYNIFTNDLMNELNSDFNSLEAIEALEKEVKSHPLKSELMEIVDMAKELLKAPNKYQSNVYELESRGDSIKESQKRKVWNFQDWQPTGIAVKSGEKINVYVDAEPGTPLPKLVFKQMDSQHNGQVVINLVRGKNEVTIPEVNSNELRPGTSKAGVLYTSNPYTAEQQIRNPKIRIDGGVSYPHFIKGVDSDEEVMKELREYNAKLEADPELPDVFEVFSDKTLVNVKATYALDWYTKNNKLPSSTADKSDEVIKETMKLWGFDGSSEVNSDFNFRYITMVKYLDNGGFMNAGNGITGYNQAEQGGALNVDTGWGFMHEMGHNFDTGGRTIVEVTNNILPLHFQRIKGERSKISEQNLWESRIFPKVSKEDYSNNEWYPESDRSLLTHLAPLWQLQLYDDTFWPRFEQYFRANNIGGGDWDNIHEAWAVAASDVLQLNLKEHFARHGFYVSEETAEHMKQYPKPTKKLWYLNDNKYLNKGEGFNSDLNYSVKPSLNQDSVKLDITIDKTNANSLLGYEIIRDGEVIGFTTKDTFTDTNITSGTNHEYKVVAYDTQLNASEGVTVKAHQPKIETIGGLTLSLNEEFNALDYVKATDYQGNKLNNITVTDNVDVTAQGKYTVTYEVNDKGTVSRETVQVNVVSEYDYLSDSEWKSVKTGHGTASRNNSIKGRTLGKIKDYDKGIRVHANGYVVYDLGEHNYDNFEVKVGVDMNLEAQNYSSITFKVIGDGETLATTKVLKHADNMQYINVPIKGVKELKIEVNDGGNGITSDHGIMVEPKLTTNNAIPKLTIPKSQTVKVGETLEDVVGTYTATDAEEGNLTEKVVVTGQDKVNFNRVGNYTITYSVTDKDGNKTEKSRVISVVNPEDFRYLSDLEWKSATKGWGTIGKDIAVGGGKLKLTGEDNKEVVYDKGIGTHAHSEIVYDLTDKNVNMFSAFVGVDRAMYNSPASIEFQVYVDGKKEYESGVMHSKDAQKFVEVDLAGAKVLKLVATVGGDTNGSDHANWADAKLYFVNTDRIDTTDLDKAIEDAKKVNKDDYTEESVKTLEDKLAKAEAVAKEENPSQEAIDTATSELQESIKGLVRINLDEVVNIPDEYLAKSLSKALCKDNNFTIGDMRKLTNFNVDYGVVSLEGLQYAKNLEIINGENNEIRDLRPISKLENLKEVNFNNQFVSVGQLKSVDGVVKVNTEVYNRSGKNVATKVKLVDNKGNLVKEQIIDKNTKEVDLDVRGIQSGFYGVHVTFEDSELSGTLLYMASI